MQLITRAWVICVLIASSALAVEKPPPVVYYPAGAAGPMPVAVWLHGYRAFPSLLEDKEYFQKTADALKVAIVGIPGTTLFDDGTPVWSEEPAADHAYIQEALAKISQKQPLDPERVMLFGFSEGAQVAADLCSRFPKSYRGAIVMSPGGVMNPKASSPSPDANKTQTFFLCCGAKENPGNVQLTHVYADWFKKLGCTVTLKEYADQEKHTRPADFKERFPEWVTAILNLPTPTK